MLESVLSEKTKSVLQKTKRLVSSHWPNLLYHHANNGKRSQSTSETVQYQETGKQRIKTFTAMTTEIPVYIQTKRQNTDIHQDVQQNMHEEERFSHMTDTLWVMAKSQAHANRAEQRIPNWTGFNYLISDDDNNSYHNIEYLPATNQLPFSHNTVLELLNQFKIKAEKLGLMETDVVLDMAIYSKAVEIFMNPRYIDLKDFIVLPLGAFHMVCIFVAVIGKRFGDAGLCDIIIESNLLGESSVDQMLKESTTTMLSGSLDTFMRQ